MRADKPDLYLVVSHSIELPCVLRTICTLRVWFWYSRANQPWTASSIKHIATPKVGYSSLWYVPKEATASWEFWWVTSLLSLMHWTIYIYINIYVFLPLHTHRSFCQLSVWLWPTQRSSPVAQYLWPTPAKPFWNRVAHSSTVHPCKRPTTPTMRPSSPTMLASWPPPFPLPRS